MTFAGNWKNQFGSKVTIVVDDDERISGMFETALEDSSLYGQPVPIVGTVQGNCICFAASARTAVGDVVVSYTGLLRDAKMETMWYFVSDQALAAAAPGSAAQLKEQKWWKAVITNMDTFERVSDDT